MPKRKCLHLVSARVAVSSAKYRLFIPTLPPRPTLEQALLSIYSSRSLIILEPPFILSEVDSSPEKFLWDIETAALGYVFEHPTSEPSIFDQLGIRNALEDTPLDWVCMFDIPVNNNHQQGLHSVSVDVVALEKAGTGDETEAKVWIRPNFVAIQLIKNWRQAKLGRCGVDLRWGATDIGSSRDWDSGQKVGFKDSPGF
ncbi:unnamed protein product [Allacma fusca]|uniref:Uncharacterized protein n=1 Tax=Allacma fusca TaxID=39272 RepID=A0A8J2L747_9HEXA|nr:unnamed protein product [Allacma fusca]